MEQRGVLVAIAGRRDGVRVYALEEIMKVVEWRMEVEIRREKDRQRRENAKKTSTTRTSGGGEASEGKSRNTIITSFLPGEQGRPLPHSVHRHSQYKSSESQPSTHPPVLLIPRAATRRTARRHHPNVSTEHDSPYDGHPPPYAHEPANPPLLARQQSYVSLSSRSRTHTANNALAGVSSQHAESSRHQDDTKTHWTDSSDEEAIDAVAAGPSGSHLDERTSATLSASSPHGLTSSRLSDPQPVPVPITSCTPIPTVARRPRPANLNLSATHVDSTPPPEPSPQLSLRNALSQLSSSNNNPPSRITTFTDVEDDDDEVDGQITLAQALMESRLPDIPPIGTSRPQQAILLAPGRSTARSTQVTPTPSIDEESRPSIGRSTNRRRRRWSLVMNSSAPEDIVEPPASAPAPAMPESFWESYGMVRSTSQRRVPSPLPIPASLSYGEVSAVPQTARSTRFLPRIISSVLNGRGLEDRPTTSGSLPDLYDGGSKRAASMTFQVPPPKLEYVKLPGTKGAVLIKAVETSKKR